MLRPFAKGTSSQPVCSSRNGTFAPSGDSMGIYTTGSPAFVVVHSTGHRRVFTHTDVLPSPSGEAHPFSTLASSGPVQQGSSTTVLSAPGERKTAGFVLFVASPGGEQGVAFHHGVCLILFLAQLTSKFLHFGSRGFSSLIYLGQFVVSSGLSTSYFLNIRMWRP